MRLAVVLLIPILAGCANGPADSPLDPTALVGSYQQALFDHEGNPVVGWPSVGSLKLEPDGRYEAWVLNGITADGCATFEGAGYSRGTWHVSVSQVHFEPDSEPADLALSLDDAAAVLAGDELVLTIGAGERRLVSPEAYHRERAAWEVRSRDGR